jgi:hypothetical protein
MKYPWITEGESVKSSEGTDEAVGRCVWVRLFLWVV